MQLPYDIARCEGVNYDGDWREGCETCLRRTSQWSPFMQVVIEPPAIIVFECENLIDPEGGE